MRPGYFDKDGAPIDRDTYARLFEDAAYRQIANDELPAGGFVSTVWLGIDHRFSSDGPPLIFETMAFGPRAEGQLIGEGLAQKRTSTVAEAQLAQVLAQLLAGELSTGKVGAA